MTQRVGRGREPRRTDGPSRSLAVCLRARRKSDARPAWDSIRTNSATATRTWSAHRTWFRPAALAATIAASASVSTSRAPPWRSGSNVDTPMLSVTIGVSTRALCGRRRRSTPARIAGPAPTIEEAAHQRHRHPRCHRERGDHRDGHRQPNSELAGSRSDVAEISHGPLEREDRHDRAGIDQDERDGPRSFCQPNQAAAATSTRAISSAHASPSRTAPMPNRTANTTRTRSKVISRRVPKRSSADPDRLLPGRTRPWPRPLPPAREPGSALGPAGDNRTQRRPLRHHARLSSPSTSCWRTCSATPGAPDDEPTPGTAPQAHPILHGRRRR